MREINHLSVHQWPRSATPDSQQPTSPIGFLFLKLPSPPCAALLVSSNIISINNMIIIVCCFSPVFLVFRFCTFFLFFHVFFCICLCCCFSLVCLFLAPVVRHDAFYNLLFCLAVRVYVYFSPHLSRGSTGWVGVGGGGGGRGSGAGGWGGLNSVLSPSSCCIFVSTRSRCYAL